MKRKIFAKKKFEKKIFNKKKFEKKIFNKKKFVDKNFDKKYVSRKKILEIFLFLKKNSVKIRLIFETKNRKKF